MVCSQGQAERKERTEVLRARELQIRRLALITFPLFPSLPSFPVILVQNNSVIWILHMTKLLSILDISSVVRAENR